MAEREILTDREGATEHYRPLLELAERLGCEAVLIPTSSVVTAPWVRLKCQYGCPGYGRGRTCPPYSPTSEQTQELLSQYQWAILLHTKKDYKLVKEVAVKVETEAFLSDYYRAWGLGAGPCHLCEECKIQEPCPNAYQVRPSMEACGIDVFKTARQCGFEIKTLREQGEEGNYFGLVLIE